MHDTHAILCFGKTLPGFDPLTVRRAIQHSFKCSEAEMNEMFSGTEVRLREALSADEAELWRQQLNSLGLKVMIDPPPLTRSPAPAGPDADGLAPHPGARRAARAEAGSPRFSASTSRAARARCLPEGRLLHLHHGQHPRAGQPDAQRRALGRADDGAGAGADPAAHGLLHAAVHLDALP
jgi:hypothetical protein